MQWAQPTAFYSWVWGYAPLECDSEAMEGSEFFSSIIKRHLQTEFNIIVTLSSDPLPLNTMIIIDTSSTQIVLQGQLLIAPSEHAMSNLTL